MLPDTSHPILLASEYGASSGAQWCYTTVPKQAVQCHQTIQKEMIAVHAISWSCCEDCWSCPASCAAAFFRVFSGMYVAQVSSQS